MCQSQDLASRKLSPSEDYRQAVVCALDDGVTLSFAKPRGGERHFGIDGLSHFGGQDLLVEHRDGHTWCGSRKDAGRTVHYQRLSEDAGVLCEGNSKFLKLFLSHRVASQINAQFLEDFLIHFAEHHRAMHLTTF